MGIPASNPVNTVVEEEEAELFRARSLVQRRIKPAAAVLQFGFEHVAVEDTTVDQSSWLLFIVFISIPVDEVPSATREEPVGSGDGRLPMLFLEGAVAIALLEPVDGAEDGARAEKEVGSHCGGGGIKDQTRGYAR